MAGANTANGTAIQLYTCNGTGAQSWSVSGTQFVNTNSGKCLDATGVSSADGTRLQIWTCTGGANQQWTLGSPCSSAVEPPRPRGAPPSQP